MFASMAGIKLTHVPYRGSGQATTDLLAGTVPMAMPGAAGMLPHIKAGKLRALAVTGAHPIAATARRADAGRIRPAGYSAYVWLGLLAPKGTPAAIVERLHREVMAALAAPEVRGYMTDAVDRESSARRRPNSTASSATSATAGRSVIKDTGAKID